MIIFRYLTKEIVNTFMMVTAILLFIFLSNELVRYLSYAASGKIASRVLIHLIAYEVPYLLSWLLPLGLYLGMLLAYSRLYADNELRVLQSSGFSNFRIIQITTFIAFIVTIFILFLTLFLNPYIASQKAKLFSEGGEANLLDTLMPGRFQVTNDGNRVVYVEKISRNHRQAKNIFIADRLWENDKNQNRWIVLSAAKGSAIINPLTKNRFILATDGYRYIGIPGQNDYQIIQFKRYKTLLPMLVTTNQYQKDASVPSAKLLTNYHLVQAASELQWRLSIPLSAFILALFAIPFSEIKPRQSRYTLFFPSILLYVIYMNLLLIARNLLEQNKVPIFIGMWWVHVCMFLLFCLFYFYKTEFFFRSKTI